VPRTVSKSARRERWTLLRTPPRKRRGALSQRALALGRSLVLLTVWLLQSCFDLVFEQPFYPKCCVPRVHLCTGRPSQARLHAQVVRPSQATRLASAGSFADSVRMWRQLSAVETLNTILHGLQTHGSGCGHGGPNMSTPEYSGNEGVLVLYESAHLDPFALQQDFFRAEKPRDVARFVDFFSVLQQKPYSLLLGHTRVDVLDEFRLGNTSYVRRIRVDEHCVNFTFSMNQRYGRWGIDFILAES